MEKVKTKKQKDIKSSKRQAFMSFLQAPTTTASITNQQSAKKANSDNQDFDEVMLQDMNCNICRSHLQTDKAKKCGFCLLYTCNEHLRKKRRKKNKFERICDSCEDKHLYESYMKLQLKNQEALSVQEQIATLKYQQIFGAVELARSKRRQLSFKNQSIAKKDQEEILRLISQQEKIILEEKKLSQEEIQIAQLQQYVRRKSLVVSKQNFQDFFNIMSQESQKLTKQLALYDKRCSEILKSIQIKQSQVVKAYETWESEQFRKSIIQESKVQKKEESSCQIY